MTHRRVRRSPSSRFLVSGALAAVLGAASIGGGSNSAAAVVARSAHFRASSGSVPAPSFTVYTAGQTPGFSADVQPFGIVAGPDGNVWFTEETGGSTLPGLGKITPSGTVTEYPTGAQGLSQPYAIVAGADGDLWFTDIAAHAIGRMTTSGTVTEFASGLSSDDVPAGLTRATDGSMWFVSNNAGSYVGRVDVTGAITEVAHLRTTTMNADPSIAQDSAGNFWFTESDHVSREYAIEVTPQGAVSRHILPLTYSFNPCCVTESTQSFAVAPDGSVWFANLTYAHQRTGVHLLGHISGGVVGAVHNRYDYTSSLAAGPDGKLWFAAQDPFLAAPTLGYFRKVDGDLHGFTMPRAANPISLAYGADGNVWMSGYNGGAGLIIMATP